MGQRDGMTGAEDLQYELILRTLTGTTEPLDGGHRNSKYVVAPNVELTYYVGIQTVSRGCLILFLFLFLFSIFWYCSGSLGSTLHAQNSVKRKACCQCFAPRSRMLHTRIGFGGGSQLHDYNFRPSRERSLKIVDWLPHLLHDVKVPQTLKHKLRTTR